MCILSCALSTLQLTKNIVNYDSTTVDTNETRILLEEALTDMPSCWCRHHTPFFLHNHLWGNMGLTSVGTEPDFS